MRRFGALGLTLAVLAMAHCTAKPTPPEGADLFEKDTFCLDEWSLVHFGSGYLLGELLGGERFPETLLLLWGYEVVEPLFWPILEPTWTGETRENQTCDILVGSLGWETATADER